MLSSALNNWYGINQKYSIPAFVNSPIVHQTNPQVRDMLAAETSQLTKPLIPLRGKMVSTRRHKWRVSLRAALHQRELYTYKEKQTQWTCKHVEMLLNDTVQLEVISNYAFHFQRRFHICTQFFNKVYVVYMITSL